jgi:hypothetical protein
MECVIVPLVLMNVHTGHGAGYPKGLIRYASEDEIEKKALFKFTARMKGTLLFSFLVGIFGCIFLRTDVEATTLPDSFISIKG